MSAPELPGYEECEPIGRGGVADVYRATRIATGDPVAIKVLRDLSDASAAWRRCRRELTALLALGGHPHVVAVLDVVAVGEHPALVVEYVPNGSLADVVAAWGGQLAAGEVARIGAQAADALAVAHARGIVHRDVKPHNLLLDAAGDVKLCDFGIAAVRRSAELGQATASVSLRFASPEDLEGDAPVGPPSDVYSLGATLLCLARGTHLELRDRLAPWTPPPTDDPALAALDAVIADCLQPDPDARPAAADVQARLAVLATPATSGEAALPMHTVPRPFPGHEPPAPREPHRPPPARPRASRRRVLAAVAAASVAGTGAWWLIGRGEPPTIDPVRVVARPTGLVDLTVVRWPSGEPGECLVQQAGRAALAPVACSEPHDLERVAAGALDDPLGTRFEEVTVDATVDAACRSAGQERVTRSLDGLRVAVSRPSADGWDAGDRAYQCFVGVPDRRLTGTPSSS